MKKGIAVMQTAYRVFSKKRSFEVFFLPLLLLVVLRRLFVMGDYFLYRPLRSALGERGNGKHAIFGQIYYSSRYRETLYLLLQGYDRGT